MSTILTKHLTEQGQMWPKYLPLATLAHNTSNSPNLANYSPYKLTFGRKPKLLIDIETDPDIKISGNFTEYYKLLEKQLRYLQDILQQFKSKCLAVINNNHKDYQYTSGDLVYIISPPYKSVKNKFMKGYHKICWTFGCLQIGRSSQLSINDIRWKNFMRSI